MATEENTYFLRSFLLLVEGGLYISRECLARECQKAGVGIDTLLKTFENKLKHEFHGKQFNKLFPQYGDTDINKWDLQLSVGVLINVFGRSLSLTEKQALRALRDLRNEIYMHCSSASLDQKKYEEVQEELEDTITTLAATFDESVRDRCSTYITQFATGPLDGVKPSFTTLNGLSQTCQKKIKVGVHTELFVCGPSDFWINMCEQTLNTIFNNAESMTSEGEGVEEIKKNVEKMLEFLQANKNVVFRGSEKACVILFFECNSYDDFLHLLQQLDSPEFQDHLKMISEALIRHYQLNTTITISSRVRTECLQSVIIDMLKMVSFEEVTPRHLEVSSENVIDEKEGNAKLIQGSEVDFCEKIESKQPIKLDLECTSKDGLLYILNSFKTGDLSDHLTSVAEALSKHYGRNITLKASLDIDDVMAAIEEAVSGDIPRVFTIPYDSEETEPQVEETKLESLSDFTDIKDSSEREHLLKLSPWLREEICYPRAIAKHLSERGLLTPTELDYIYSCIPRRIVTDRLLQLVLKRPTHRYKEFKRALEIYEGTYTLGRILREIANKQDIAVSGDNMSIYQESKSTEGHKGKTVLDLPVLSDYKKRTEQVKDSEENLWKKKPVAGIASRLETVLFVIVDTFNRCDLAFK